MHFKSPIKFANMKCYRPQNSGLPNSSVVFSDAGNARLATVMPENYFLKLNDYAARAALNSLYLALRLGHIPADDP